jgi:hypothetical protein
MYGHLQLCFVQFRLSSSSAARAEGVSYFGVLGRSPESSGKGLPLREVLVTTDVSALASITTFVRLGMPIKYQSILIVITRRQAHTSSEEVQPLRQSGLEVWKLCVVEQLGIGDPVRLRLLKR